MEIVIVLMNEPQEVTNFFFNSISQMFFSILRYFLVTGSLYGVISSNKLEPEMSPLADVFATAVENLRHMSISVDTFF